MNAVMAAEGFHVERDDKRDGRVMSAMDDETKYIHARLEEWARFRRNQFAELGLPQITYLHKWIEYGIDGAQQHGKPAEMPQRVAIVDAAVSSLGQIDGRVIRAYYGPPAPREIKARDCGMRIRQFDAVLRRARWRVGAFVAGAEAEI